MKAKADVARPKKYPGYKRLLVLWHESTGQEFDPVPALKALADARGLVVDEKASRLSHRLRVDSVQSSKLRRPVTPQIDKKDRQEAAKLLRRALRDPASAERIKDLIERARRGEDISQVMPDALDSRR